jgi:hypothetical protein
VTPGKEESDRDAMTASRLDQVEARCCGDRPPTRAAEGRRPGPIRSARSTSRARGSGSGLGHRRLGAVRRHGSDPVVGRNNVRPRSLGDVDGFLGGGRLPDDLDVLDPAEEGTKALPEDHVVIDDPGVTVSRPPRGVVTAAGLIVFAAVTLTPWLLTSSSDPQRSVTPTQAAASPQHAARGHASARSYAPNIEPLTAYALFCQNSLSLCAPAAPTPPNPGYVRFCWNSPTLCTVLKPN